MYLKILGFFVLFLCAYIFGKEKSRCYASGVELTEALARLVKYTGERIETFREPLSVIFASFSDDTLSVCDTDNMLTEGKIIPFSEKVAPIIPEDAEKLFSRFAREIGSGYGESQTALCRYTSDKLFEISERMNTLKKEKTRMYKLLPLLAACVVIILLI